MLDFALSDGRTLTLEQDGDSLVVKVWSADTRELDAETNWDINSVADMLLLEG